MPCSGCTTTTPPAAAAAAHEKDLHTVLLECTLKSARLDGVSSEGLRCRVPTMEHEVPAFCDTERSAVCCKVPAAYAGQSCCVIDAAGNPVCDGCAADIPEPVKPAFKAQDVIEGLSIIDRLLALWIILAMIIGVLIGYYVPSAKTSLETVQVDKVSLPVALGLWGMMWPVLAKVKYEVLGVFFKRRDSWVQMGWSVFVNWVVGPWVMLALAWITLPDVPGYRNGIIIVGIARCIAMVLIWNQLARGDPEYCAIMVAINSVLQMVLFAPYSLLLLQVVSRQYLGDDGGYQLDFWTVCRSVLIFLGAPLVAGVITRYALIRAFGEKWYNEKFMKWFGPVALISLLYTIIVLFALQGHQVISQIGDVCRIAVPMVLYFAIMWFACFFFFYKMGYSYPTTVTQSFTGSSNNFELAIAIAAGTFGSSSPEALAATIGPLIEVPALLLLVYVALWLQPKLAWKSDSTLAADKYLADAAAKAGKSGGSELQAIKEEELRVARSEASETNGPAGGDKEGAVADGLKHGMSEVHLVTAPASATK